MDLNFRGIKNVETAKLLVPIWEKELAREQARQLGIDYDRPKFFGRNPLTGVDIIIVFNEPAPGRSSVMNWNTLTQCWFYSEDAGLTWKRVDTKKEYIQYLSKTDCLMNTEYQPGFE